MTHESDLAIKEKIGAGSFNDVYRATLTHTSAERTVRSTTIVAVAQRRDEDATATKEEVKQLIKLGHHCNLTKYLGMCYHSTRGRLVITEFAEQGSLLQLMERCSKDDLSRGHHYAMLRQICSGMAALIDVNIVHRDLAARNILVFGFDPKDPTKTCVKVADFGLSVDTYGRGSITSDTVQLPYRWMAPEAIQKRSFSERTDIWSFGVTAWELLTHGDMPSLTGGLTDTDSVFTARVVSGERLPKPQAASAGLWACIEKCWLEAASERPTFSALETDILELSQGKRTTKEGVSYEEARELLEVVREAPRWFWPASADQKPMLGTSLGFEFVTKDGEDDNESIRRIQVTTTPTHEGTYPIVAAVADSVIFKGTLFKVVKVSIDTSIDEPRYTLEWLQHWQVPSPCDPLMLGWPADYRDVAEALAAGLAGHDEEKLRTEGQQKDVDGSDLQLARDYITFNDVKNLVVVPQLESGRIEKAKHSLAYAKFLGPASSTCSADQAIRIDTDVDVNGEGLRSRRASIFFSWSFTQLFRDFVDAFCAFLAEDPRLEDDGTRRRVYAWISPLSLSQDPVEMKKLQTEDWADRFEELVRTIGRDGFGTVLLWTPSDNPEPMTRMWCIWEMFITKKTNSRLTVQAPRGIDLSTATPSVKSEDAQDNGGAAAKLVRRVLETQVLSGAGTELSYRGINTFVLNAFKEAVERRESGSGGGRGGGGRSGRGDEALAETTDRMIMQLRGVEKAKHKFQKASQEKLLRRRHQRDPSLLVEHSARHSAALVVEGAAGAAEARERLAARRARASPRRQTPMHGVGESSDGERAEPTQTAGRRSGGGGAGRAGGAEAEAAGPGAREGSGGNASTEWQQLHDSESGNPYWHNTRTGETSWTLHTGRTRAV